MKRLCTFLVVAAVGCGGGGSGAAPGGGGTAGTADSAGDGNGGDGSGGSAGSGSETAGGGSGGTTDSRFIETIEGALAGEVSGLLERIELDQAAAYSGFDIDVREVLIGVDGVGFDVAQVNLTLTNRTRSRARLQTTVEIESQGSVAELYRDGTPQLDAGASGEGYFSLRLARSFPIADGILFIGRPDRNRVQIPLGEAGQLVTRAPVLVPTTSSAADDTSSIALTGITLAWDSADPRAQSEPGSAFLRVEYALDSGVSTALSDDVLSLRLPSGDVVEPEQASIATVEAGQSAEGLFGLFPVSDPAAGDYVLIYTERFGNGGVEVPFAVP